MFVHKQVLNRLITPLGLVGRGKGSVHTPNTCVITRALLADVLGDFKGYSIFAPHLIRAEIILKGT